MSISRVAATGVIMGTVLIGISPVASATPPRVTVKPDPVAANHKVAVATDACSSGTSHARAYSHAFRPVPLRPVRGGVVAGTTRIPANVGDGTYRVTVACRPNAGPAATVTGTVTVKGGRHHA
jgi:hypothetical protein